jgi:hypothetical protein
MSPFCLCEIIHAACIAAMVGAKPSATHTIASNMFMLLLICSLSTLTVLSLQAERALLPRSSQQGLCAL